MVLLHAMAGMDKMWTSAELLRVAFCGDTGREGYYTAGHEAPVSETDVYNARTSGSNLMYGEFLPAGFSKAMDAAHLWAARGGFLLELGSGTGKPALQALLEFPFERVTGVELCVGRHAVGVDALKRLCGHLPSLFHVVEESPSRIVVATALQAPLRLPAEHDHEPERSSQEGWRALEPLVGGGSLRYLTLRHGDMLATAAEEIASATVLVMETCLPRPIFPGVCRLLVDAGPEARLLMYNDLRDVAAEASLAVVEARAGRSDGNPGGENTDDRKQAARGFDREPVATREVERDEEDFFDRSVAAFGLLNVDRFHTSWSPVRGHPFYVYERCDHQVKPEHEDTTFLDVVLVPRGGKCPPRAKEGADSTAASGALGGGLFGWKAGDEVETRSVFFPSDAWFDGAAGGEWYRGWIIRVVVDGAECSKPGKDGEHRTEGGEEGEGHEKHRRDSAPPCDDSLRFTVIYEDGDVGEDIPLSLVRRPPGN